jgi:UDPglucose--hexose-1-phosphate uridylyltransferase
MTTANELRKDYLLDRWVVIACQRKKRPTDFAKPTAQRKQQGLCAFCPGNERMTPQAVLLYLPKNGGIQKTADRNGERPCNWLVRVVPNLYPAFMPPSQEEEKYAESDFTVERATGHHEVLIESPQHDEHIGAARVSQVVHVVNAYIDRFRELSSKPYVKYVSIFRNHGLEAGASLSHTHTQIIATCSIPKTVEDELKVSEAKFKKDKRCIFCETIEKEKRSPRFIWENDDYLVFAPWASVHPFEFWLFPKEHQCCFRDLSKSQVKSLAEAMRVSLGGLKSILNDPPYNFGFHQICSEPYHWHLEVYPRLSIWAGFEKSTGMFINVVAPEDAAVHLKEAMLAEEKKI